MIQHYLKIAIRNLFKQKGLAFINIIGLSIGLACFILFLLFAVHEFSFDRFHKKASHIYRAVEWIQGIPGREPGGEAFGGTPLGPAMKNDFADVNEYARIQRRFDESFVRADNEITRSKISFADPQLFKIFDFKMLKGNAAIALSDPRNIVLTRQKAMQLFGETEVVGRRVDIKIEDKFEPFIVGAVTENIPSNSSIQFSI